MESQKWDYKKKKSHISIDVGKTQQNLTLIYNKTLNKVSIDGTSLTVKGIF